MLFCTTNPRSSGRGKQTRLSPSFDRGSLRNCRLARPFPERPSLQGRGHFQGPAPNVDCDTGRFTEPGACFRFAGFCLRWLRHERFAEFTLSPRDALTLCTSVRWESGHYRPSIPLKTSVRRLSLTWSKLTRLDFTDRTNFKAERLGSLEIDRKIGWRHSRWNTIGPPALIFIPFN